MESISIALLRQRGHNLWMLTVLADIDASMRGSTVPYVVLKGLPLSQALYGSPTVRPARDLDILVTPDNFDSARRLLERLGFAPESGLGREEEAVTRRFAADIALRRADGALVELHDRIDLNPPRAGAMCARALLDAASPTPVGNITVPSIVGPAALPYLAWHGGNHAWACLFWLLDVAEISRRASASEIESAWEAAGALGGQRPLALAWRLCDELLGVPVPETARSTANARPVSRLAETVTKFIASPSGLGRVGSAERRLAGLRWSFDLAPSPGARSRLLVRYLMDVQPEEVRSLRLPRGLRWLYPILRPFRVAARLTAMTARSVKRRLTRRR